MGRCGCRCRTMLSITIMIVDMLLGVSGVGKQLIGAAVDIRFAFHMACWVLWPKPY